MERRSFLAGILFTGVAGAGVVAYRRPEFIEENTGVGVPDADTNNSETPMRAEFDGLLNNIGFTHIQWHEDGRLTIGWADDHDMDGCLIRHEYKDSIEDAIGSFAAPEFGGERTIDFVSVAELDSTEYPTYIFDLIAAKGSITDRGLSVIDETVGSVSFEVPPDIRSLPKPTTTTDEPVGSI